MTKNCKKSENMDSVDKMSEDMQDKNCECKNNTEDSDFENNIDIKEQDNGKEAESFEEVNPLVKENEDLKNHLLRTKAELDNFIKRTEKDKVQLKDHYTIKVIERFLPLVDSFEQALKNSPEDQGIKLLYDQLNSTLASFNVRPIDVVDKQFDVAYHEVLMEQLHEAPKGTIVEEVQKGYFIGDKILRHAKVVVSKGSE